MLPSLYISHGSPMLAIDPGPTGAAFDALGGQLRTRRPRAVLVISAHWIYSTLAVSSRERQEAWHDFGGFPRELYALRYDAPGSPALAGRVKALVEAAAVPGAGFVGQDDERPLDHGAWMPMRHFFPDADVPVVQLALNPYLSPATQIEIGRALAPLRDEGVLVLASGSFTHNLQEVFGGGRRDQHGPQAEPYVEAFRDWMAEALDEALASGDTSRIADYRAQAPYARRAHPTDEHLLPLFVALGAALGPQAASGAGPAPASVSRVADEVTYGVLAMDSFVFEGLGAGAPLRAAA
ncbi:Aromatic ring-opening dioxygenase, catalytic subunit, LigB family [Cupriavidus necator]|uniref:Dioxygenase n=1 Tax=Cupriavidus necator (strain ATCC 17699 / DSM 428 / KCTC 22496 / NCIMB 10442 / H16 / Stanier 337) TaxID=381666 RepID=Q0K5V8_CUPNH|nr:class III extradiol ring-cleavage dioxygenase [Cupriavidus necator]QCC02357.1 dioxygenase [Cupriavidus necator H16]QQB78237.1 dioxygenase [Cupriavidus necator]WKA40764.1 class III extradiol ring-cleavage dioxygenase [Cupriavidus necator]CAJ94613.1 catalytic subunit of aromatic ring-opening dioxygenase [Cupriavidus necator H16]